MKGTQNTLLFVALLIALVTVVALPSIALASPIGTIKTFFQEGIDFFLKYLVPGVAMALIGWTGLMVAGGKKDMTDTLPVLIGCGVALFAGPIVAWIMSQG